MVFSESEYSSRRNWPAMPMLRRSRYVKTLVNVTRTIICQRTEVGRGERAGPRSSTTGGGGGAHRESPFGETWPVQCCHKWRCEEDRDGSNDLVPLRAQR